MERAFNNASDKAMPLQSIWEKVKDSKTEMDSEARNLKLYVVNFLERLRYQESYCRKDSWFLRNPVADATNMSNLPNNFFWEVFENHLFAWVLSQNLSCFTGKTSYRERCFLKLS